uniref:Uncharacterized protein n=1 Tax=Anguilla anguilla TaxID=7936 RepID=A0A0E9W2I3_ANGAN
MFIIYIYINIHIRLYIYIYKQYFMAAFAEKNLGKT